MLRFWDTKIGWIAGTYGRTMKTVDGGKNWQIAPNIAENYAVLNAIQARAAARPSPRACRPRLHPAL